MKEKQYNKMEQHFKNALAEIKLAYENAQYKYDCKEHFIEIFLKDALEECEISKYDIADAYGWNTSSC